MFDTIGTIEMITQTMMRVFSLYPKIDPRTGEMTRIGIAWRATRYGHRLRSSQRAGVITNARAMPSRIEIPKPTSISRVVTHSALNMLLRGVTVLPSGCGIVRTNES